MPYTDPHSDDVDEAEDTPLVKRLREQIKDQTKVIKGLETKVETFETQSRTSTISGFLEKKGAKPGLAKFVERDVADATPEALEKWYTENAEILGLPTATTESAGEDDAVEEAETPGVDAATIEGIKRTQAAQAAGSGGPGSIGNDKVLKAAREAAASGGAAAMWKHLEANGLAGNQ